MVRRRGSTAKRICGPLEGLVEPLAMMESRAWGANRLHDPEGRDLLSARPHAGPTGSHPRERAVREKGSGSDLLDLRVPLEGTLIAPDTPSDTCDAIGEGNGSGIVAAGLGGPDGPGLELIGLLGTVGCIEGGAGAVDEEHAGVGITSFGDAAQATTET